MQDGYLCCRKKRFYFIVKSGILILFYFFSALADVSFMLRSAHLQKLKNIIDDPEATDNDRFVAYNLLQNAAVAIEGALPSCQDTGTAICVAKKGENVCTGAEDAEWISKGIYNTYQEKNLR